MYFKHSLHFSPFIPLSTLPNLIVSVVPLIVKGSALIESIFSIGELLMSRILSKKPEENRKFPKLCKRYLVIE